MIAPLHHEQTKAQDPPFGILRSRRVHLRALGFAFLCAVLAFGYVESRPLAAGEREGGLFFGFEAAFDVGVRFPVLMASIYALVLCAWFLVVTFSKRNRSPLSRDAKAAVGLVVFVVIADLDFLTRLVVAEHYARIAESASASPSDALAAFEVGSFLSDEPIMKALVVNPRTPKEIVERVVALPWPTLGNDSGAPRDRLRGHSWSVLRLLAANPAAPPEMLNRLSQSKDWKMRRTVATNPAAPQEVLEALARDSGAIVRQAAALNPAASDAIRLALLHDEDGGVRDSAIHVLEASPGVVTAILEDPDPSIAIQVAKSPRAQLDLVAGLSVHRSRAVRLEVARRPGIATEVLQRLAKDEDKQVSDAARQALGIRKAQETGQPRRSPGEGSPQ